MIFITDETGLITSATPAALEWVQMDLASLSKYELSFILINTDENTAPVLQWQQQVLIQQKKIALYAQLRNISMNSAIFNTHVSGYPIIGDNNYVSGAVFIVRFE